MTKYEKEYLESTLMNMNKKWLVEYIQCLVHNNNALQEQIDNQANYLKELQRLCGDKFLCHMNCVHRNVDRRVGEERKNEKKKYRYGWFICCALYSVFLTIIGYPIITWEWWVGEIIFCVGGWCSLNMN